MESTERALVLKVGKFREHDAWVRLFSPGKGVFTGFAFGGLKSRRRFCGCLDVFNQVLFKVKTNPGRQGMVQLLEGTLLSSSPGLRRNLDSLGMAFNCAKFFEAAQAWQDNAGQAYSLLLELIETLGCAESPPSLLPMYFRVRVAFDCGYAPDFTSCFGCGCELAHSGAGFDVRGGRAYCPDCGRAFGNSCLWLSPETLALLDGIKRRNPGQWLGFTPSAATRRQYQALSESFVGHHLGLAWENGYFRRI